MILQAFVRGAIIIGIAALLATLLRHRSAALRHHVWATAVVVQLALLAFIPVLPTIHLPIIPTIAVQTDAPLENTTVDRTTNDETTPVTANQTNARGETGTLGRSEAAPNRPTSPPADRPISDYLLFAWMAGAAFILLRYIIGTLVMLRLAIKGERVEDGAWLVLAQRTARELGITRPITMIWGDKVSVPITWGVLYPMILLPKSAQEWPTERRRFVLVHEMAHVKRFDALTQFLAQITAAIFWFSPFVWFAEWRMRIEREHACDDTVIQHGTEPAVYADELLQMVRSLVRRRSPQPAFAALAMARKSEFEGRMLAILDPERPRRVTGITSGVMFALLSVLIAAPLAAVDPFAFRVTTTPTAQLAQKQVGTAPPVTEPIVPTEPIEPARTAARECDFGNAAGGITILVGSNKEVDIKFAQSGRCATAHMAGPVQLSPDEQKILAVRAGGFVRLREMTPRRDLQLVIEHNSNGGLKRSFTINGRVPDDDGRTEREWVARVLPELLAEGAIEPQERVRRMLQSNGLNATLEQIAAFSSSSARYAHFEALVKLGGWSQPELARIRARAVASLQKSPSYLAEFDKVLPQKASIQPQAGAGKVKRDVELMDALLTGITSGYDLHMAMQSQLDDADRDVLLLFARHALKINSSYELAGFLTAAKSYYLGRNDVALEDAWFTAAVRITSAYDRATLLTNALSVAEGSERLTYKFINAADGMASTSDKASFLTAIAKKKLITTPALRTAFLVQVNTIKTGVDRRYILEAL